MRKVRDRAGKVRGKKRQGLESVESKTEYHCSKDEEYLSGCMKR